MQLDMAGPAQGNDADKVVGVRTGAQWRLMVGFERTSTTAVPTAVRVSGECDAAYRCPTLAVERGVVTATGMLAAHPA